MTRKPVLATVLTAALAAANPIPAAAEPARTEISAEEATAKGREALAYSYGLQAFLFAFPLFMVERERVRREKVTAPIPFEPVAPINQLGHMSKLATAQGDLPYSPNNDTVYTGIIFDLEKEPIILEMPEIKDRYAAVHVANAYVENQPYLYSPRVNGGNKMRIAFVGPDWTGTLPDGVEEMRLDTNTAGATIRIAVKDEADLENVRRYQSQMSVTALSDWNGGPSATPPTPPAPRQRTQYKGEFARFKMAADLLAENPPPARHAAILATLWRIGIVPGEKFDPEKLDPDTRRGLLRAERDGAIVMEYLRRNRGKRFPSGWDTGRYSPDIAFDYSARAAMALVGLTGNDPEESIYFYTFFDSERQLLDGSKKYRIHLTPETIPQTGDVGFWSITMYDGKTFMFVDNPINRYAIGSRSDLMKNDDGSIDIWIQADSPGADKESNWLPAPAAGEFRVTFRIYSPVEEMVQKLYALDLALPPLEPVRD